MKKPIALFALSYAIVLLVTACTLLARPLDKRTGFTSSLIQLEDNIRNEKWDAARNSLEDCNKAWRRLKPLMQIDIDHDYVNDIEACLVILEGYIETTQKPDAIVTVLLIKDAWKNIGSL